MRIIAGTAGGRRLRVPPEGTRPTSDRVRESLFAALQSRLDFDGIVVLDLYAGSGALGLEALSRGAAEAVLVERDRLAFEVLRRNAADLGLAGARCVQGEVRAVLARGPAACADLVLCDPPYDLPAEQVRQVLDDAVRFGWVSDDAIAVVERSARDQGSPWPSSWAGDRTRTVGETALWYGHVHDLGREPQ